MDKKTVIVTGANDGIGKETAKELAKMGAKVIMACRNMDKGRKAKDEIIKATRNKEVILKHIDLSSFQSIRHFAHEINNSESRLDVLINNAGIGVPTERFSQDGLEMTMATNHYGPFLLTHLLIDLLKKTKSSRIIVVSSITNFLGTFNVNKPEYTSAFYRPWNYFNSKFANLCFTLELAKRLENTGVTVNSVHPGLISTDIWINNISFPFSWIIWLLWKTIFQTPAEGCQTIVYLASSEDVSNISGKYFVNCKPAYVNPRARNRDRNKMLWALSEKVVKLTDKDPEI